MLTAFGSVALGALFMQRVGQLIGITALALTLFVAGSAARTLLAGQSAAETSLSGRAVQQVETGVGSLLNMQTGALLAYFLAFMLIILVLYILKSIVAR